MKHFDRDYLEIHWDEKVKCVTMVWKKYTKGDDFRDGLNAGLDLVVQKKANKWLADMTNMQVLALDDQNWANTDWFPRAIAGGIRKMALITPKSALATMGVKNIMNKIGDVELETAYFENIDEATAWLMR